MKISTKGRYALRLMLDMAQHRSEGCVALKDVAERQDISKKYLEQIALTLSQAGLLVGLRGHQGGYRLVGAPADWTVLQVLSAVEGSLAPVTCLDGENACPRRDACLTLPLWAGLDRVIDEYLGGVTLQDLLEERLPAAEKGGEEA